MNATMISRSGARLTPTFVERGHPHWQYFNDPEGNLWGSKRGTPPRLVARRGARGEEGETTPSEGTLQDRFAKPMPAAPEETPAPEQVPAPTVTESNRRYSFTYRTIVGGVVGELTIEATTGFEMAGALKEAARRFKPIKEPPTAFVVFPDDTAWCVKHSAVMQPREKQGDKWWSHDVGGECFCKGRPGKDSPGWDK